MREFIANSLVYDAVLRNLEVLGEAAKGIPDEIRQCHPAVEWRKIAGLRDVLTHRYFGLEDETVWDIVRNKVPFLLSQLRRIQQDAGLSGGRSA